MSQPNIPSGESLLRQAHDSMAATEIPSGPSPELIRRVNDQMRASAPSISRDGLWGTRRLTRYAAAAVVFFAAIGLTMLSPGGNHVLADVVKQLEDLKSGKARLTRTVDGVEVESTNVFFKGKSLQRMEFSSGDIDVVNLQRGEHTRLMAAEKKVVVEPAYALPAGEDPISHLKSIASRPMSRIAARSIDGASHALGFSRQESRTTETIWVDPETRLPIRGESTFKDADGRMVTLTLDGLEYNVDLEDSLFEIGVPEAYASIDRRPAKVAGTVDVGTMELVLSPNKGLGPITFGMSREAVIKLLGTPDSTEVMKPEIEVYKRLLDNPNLADSHDAISKDIERMKQSERFLELPELLKYRSIGFELSLSASEGVVAISCYGQRASASRDFKGRTHEGLQMLDSRKRIEQLYGKPDSVHAGDGFCQLSYSQLGFTMDLINDELVSLSARKAND